MNDILLNSTLDAKIDNGDFVTGGSTEWHQLLLLQCSKGDFKENPTICIGAAGWLKDDVGGLLAEVKKEFERDGMTVKKLELTNDNLITDASYKETTNAN